MTASDPRPRASKLQILNALWFAILVGVFTVWFRTHLQEWFTRATLIGGTMGLWAVINVAQSVFGVGWGGEKGPILQRFLSREYAWEYLLVLTILAGFLYCTTYSIHLTRGDERLARAPVVAIEAREHGQRFGETVEFGAGRLTYSRPFLLRFGPRDFRFFLVDAYDRDTIRRTLRPFGRLDLEVPNDFKRLRFHLLRIVPGPGLYPTLSDSDPASIVPIRMIITARNGTWADTVDVLKKNSVYIGADTVVLSLLRRDVGDELLRRQVLMEWERQELSEEAVSAAADYERFRLIGSPRLDAGEEIVLRLKRKNTEWSQTEYAPDQEDIRTVFVSGPPGNP
jgi:hypothetical protein